jgi:hypothetical protein
MDTGSTDFNVIILLLPPSCNANANTTTNKGRNCHYQNTPITLIHYFFFLDFALASRWTLYAIATACLTGLPDFTSAETFLSKQFCEAHFLSGIL